MDKEQLEKRVEQKISVVTLAKVTDVYAATAPYFYVSFSTELSDGELNDLAAIGFHNQPYNRMYPNQYRYLLKHIPPQFPEGVKKIPVAQITFGEYTVSAKTVGEILDILATNVYDDEKGTMEWLALEDVHITYVMMNEEEFDNLPEIDW